MVLQGQVDSPYKLPSGQTVVLNLDGVEIRSVQRQPGEGVIRSFHPTLSQLVDVDHHDPSHSTAGAFTGYSVANILDGQCTWSAKDRTAFSGWIRSIEDEIGEAIVLRAVPPPQSYRFRERLSFNTFISPLQQAIQSLPLNRAAAEQWRGTLKNLASRGIRQDELEWSGILERIADTDLPIARETILGWLSWARTRLVLGNESVVAFDPSFEFERTEDPIAIRFKGRRGRIHSYGQVKAKNKSLGYKIVLAEANDLFNPDCAWFVLNERREIVPASSRILGYQSSLSAEQAARHHVMNRFRGYGSEVPDPRWRRYVLPGGTQYREWLLVMPDFLESFWSDHFATPNVVLHLRTTTRSDLFGTRVLFVEELQSDWHETGRREGYGFGGKAAPPAPFSKDWHELGLKCALHIAASQHLDGIALSPGAVQLSRFPAELGLGHFYDEILPRSLDKLVRPLGCAVQRTFAKVAEGSYFLVRKNLRWFVATQANEICSPSFQYESLAWRWLDKRTRSREMAFPFVQFSDSLRRTLLMDGIPRYGGLSRLGSN